VIDSTVKSHKRFRITPLRAQHQGFENQFVATTQALLDVAGGGAGIGVALVLDGHGIVGLQRPQQVVATQGALSSYERILRWQVACTEQQQTTQQQGTPHA
jgi:hypothetical protein